MKYTILWLFTIGFSFFAGIFYSDIKTNNRRLECGKMILEEATTEKDILRFYGLEKYFKHIDAKALDIYFQYRIYQCVKGEK